MNFRNIVLAGASLIALSCRGFAAEQTVYSGRYSVGFETSEFLPCGTQERWWMSGNLDKISRKLHRSSMGPIQTLFVQVRGEVSAPGRYGHLGAYQRKITVDRVLIARRLRPGECR